MERTLRIICAFMCIVMWMICISTVLIARAEEDPLESLGISATIRLQSPLLYTKVGDKNCLDTMPVYTIHIEKTDEAMARVFLNEEVIVQNLSAEELIIDLSDFDVSEGKNTLSVVATTGTASDANSTDASILGSAGTPIDNTSDTTAEGAISEPREIPLAKETFYLDFSAPVIEQALLYGEEVALGDSSMPNEYRLFPSKEASLLVSAVDTVSGVSHIQAEYRTLSGDLLDKKEFSCEGQTADIRLPAGFKGYVRVVPIDNVGRIGDGKSSLGMVVGGVPAVSEVHLLVDKKEVYGEPVTVSVEVRDAFCGIDNISYTIQNAGRTTEQAFNQEQLLGLQDWKIATDENLVTEAKTAFVVEEEGEAIQITLSMKNRFGQTIAESLILNIDLTTPNIQIEGVEDRSANRGSIRLSATATDRTLDTKATTVSLKRLDGTPANISHITSNKQDSLTWQFEDFSYEKEWDGIYVFTVEATDLAGHTQKESREFSVNRFGSAYSLSEEVAAMNGKYNRKAHDVVLIETNVDEIRPDTVTVRVVRDGIPVSLQQSDYQIEEKAEKGWHCNTYTIPSAVFADDASYKVIFSSTDRAGNNNDSDSPEKLAGIRFGIDATPPLIALLNIEEGETIQAKSHEVLALIEDNLVLEDTKVLVNNQRIKPDIKEDEYRFVIDGQEQEQQIYLEATDAAGNTSVLRADHVLIGERVGSRIENLIAPEGVEAVKNVMQATGQKWRVILLAVTLFGFICISGLGVYAWVTRNG